MQNRALYATVAIYMHKKTFKWRERIQRVTGYHRIISEHNNFKKFFSYLTQIILQFSGSSCTLHLTKVGNLIVFRRCLTEGTCIWCCEHI